MTVHQFAVGLGPHKLKKMFFKKELSQPSLGEISVVFLYKAVYRSSSALIISG
jgi:hypothetical protein